MDRSQLKAAYKGLYEEVEEILFRHDPEEINFGFNTDEYDPEVGTILPRLREARSEADVHEIIFEEFARWCSVEDKDGEVYRAMSSEIWAAWVRFSKAQVG